jgi:hypothetical protein
VALADQNFWNGRGAIEQNQRGGIDRAAIGVMIGFLFYLFRLAHRTPAAHFCFLM